MPKRALLLMLDFPNWEQARPWGYPGNFAWERGLQALGYECVTVPILGGVPPASPLSWLPYLRRLLAGMQFDTAWIWLVHTAYDEPFWEWFRGIAPLRVGLIPESLKYDREVADEYGPFAERATYVKTQARALTHALVADEMDAAVLRAEVAIEAEWFPSPVPSGFMAKDIQNPEMHAGAFYGVPYGERVSWLNREELKRKVIKPPSAETRTNFPQMFDNLQRTHLEQLNRAAPPDVRPLLRHSAELRALREEIFRNWLVQLRRWAAIVNLPSFGKLYAGRVFESIAAGVPVISWRVPGHPRTAQLFEEGREILLFDQDRPAELENHLDRILGDSLFRELIAVNGLRRSRAHYSAERIVGEIVAWMEAGKRLPW